jgi:hypothetical protein
MDFFRDHHFWSAEEKKQDGSRFLRNDETAIIEAEHGNRNGKKGKDQSNQQIFDQSVFYRMDHAISLPLAIFTPHIIGLF